jgi:hypothetical protein
MHTGQKKNWHHLNKSSFVGVVCADFSNGFPVSFLSLLLKRMKRRTNVRKNMRSRGFARSWLCPPRRGPFFFHFFRFYPSVAPLHLLLRNPPRRFLFSLSKNCRPIPSAAANLVSAPPHLARSSPPHHSTKQKDPR